MCPACRFATGSELCRRWDCINVRQRERAKEARFRSRHVPSHVPSHPQNAAKVRGFPVQPRRSPLRQTACWRKADSNRWSHLRVSTTAAPARCRQGDENARCSGSSGLNPPSVFSTSIPPSTNFNHQRHLISRSTLRSSGPKQPDGKMRLPSHQTWFDFANSLHSLVIVTSQRCGQKAEVENRRDRSRRPAGRMP
jgi:hypothetical protein